LKVAKTANDKNAMLVNQEATAIVGKFAEPVINEFEKPLAEVVKEPSAEVVKEPLAEVVKEPSAEVVKEPLAEVVKEPLAEAVKEPLAEVVKEPLAEVVKKPLAEVVKKPLAEVSKEPLAALIESPIAPKIEDPLTQNATKFEQLVEPNKSIDSVSLARNLVDPQALASAVRMPINDIAYSNNLSSSDVFASPAAPVEDLVVLRTVSPKYPDRAVRKNIEGWVEVAYQVNEKGRAVNIQIVNSEPRKVFDKSTINAMKKWRFEAVKDIESGQPKMSKVNTKKFSFDLDLIAG